MLDRSGLKTPAAVSAIVVAASLVVAPLAQQQRPRARDLGIAPGVFPPGPLNAITDVAGVRVGHTTRHRGRHRAHRRDGDPAARRQPVSGEGAGRRVRRQRVRQARRLDAGRGARHDRDADRAHQHAVASAPRSTRSSAGRSRSRATRTCARSTRSSARPTTAGSTTSAACTSRASTCSAAIAGAKSGAVDEGGVGAGTGTIAFGWKGGIGTSSRSRPRARRLRTVGVLVQTNYGGV